MLQFPKVEVNKLSKIYNQDETTNETFPDVDSAKQFFITEEALDTFNEYCYRQEWQLTNNNRSLHWTISFELDTQSTDVSNSDQWRDVKSSMTIDKTWFADEHYPEIDHEAKNLF